MDAFDHVVVVMLENQSFDRVLGWVPGADGRNLEMHGNYADPNGPMNEERVPVHPNARLASVSGPHYPPERVFAQIHDPESGFVSSQIDNFSGSPDEVIVSAVNDVMGYFEPEALPVTRTLAENFLVCDRWFSPMGASTAPNRFFLFYGTSPTGSRAWFTKDYPTLLERLTESAQARALTQDRAAWRMYVDGLTPHIGMTKLFTMAAGAPGDNIKPFWRENRRETHFAVDVAEDNLAALTVIEPRHFTAGDKFANSNHWGQHLHRGERLLASIYNALCRSRLFARTLLVVTYDEHGGFYDHVRTCGAPHPDNGVVGREAHAGALDWYGPRVPTILISPQLPRGVFPTWDGGARPAPADWATDHTWIAALLSERWKLGHISHRVDANRSRLNLPLERVEPVPGPFDLDDLELATDAQMLAGETEAKELFESAKLSEPWWDDLRDSLRTMFGRRPVPGDD